MPEKMPIPERESDSGKVPETLRKDIERVFLEHKRSLSAWSAIDDDEVKIVKDAIRKALNIPESEAIRVSAPQVEKSRSDPAVDMNISVYSTDNPLRRYCSCVLRYKADRIDDLKINIKSSESDPKIDDVLLNALGVPSDARQGLTFRRTEDGDTTHHEIRKGKTILGSIEVNERTSKISAISPEKEAIDALRPKKLEDCIKLLGEEKILHDKNLRRIVEDAIRNELNLPPEFKYRGLFLTGKQSGDDVEITIEDKNSEKVIATMTYSSKTKSFTDYSKESRVINEIVKSMRD